MLNYNVKVGLFGLRRDVTPRPGIFNWEKAEDLISLSDEKAQYLDLFMQLMRVAYARNIREMKNWSEQVARLVYAAGTTDESIVQICFGYGMFTGALGLHYGLENIGAAIGPSSTGNSQKQIMYMQDFETSLLVATPSYALRLAEVAREMGVIPFSFANCSYA